MHGPICLYLFHCLWQLCWCLSVVAFKPTAYALSLDWLQFDYLMFVTWIVWVQAWPWQVECSLAMCCDLNFPDSGKTAYFHRNWNVYEISGNSQSFCSCGTILFSSTTHCFNRLLKLWHQRLCEVGACSLTVPQFPFLTTVTTKLRMPRCWTTSRWNRSFLGSGLSPTSPQRFLSGIIANFGQHEECELVQELSLHILVWFQWDNNMMFGISYT